MWTPMTLTPYRQSCLRWSRQTNKEATTMAGSLFERLRPSSIEATPIESAPSAEEAPAAVSLLEKLEAERPLPIVELPALSPLERLQEWIDRRWRKSTISAFEIYT